MSGSTRRRKARPTREDVLGASALEAPVPGPLLVLLSRLHRSEPTSSSSGENDQTA